MKKVITTKDLMGLNDLMTFENWLSTKMKFCAENTTSKELQTKFNNLAKKHSENHAKLLEYLTSNSQEASK